MSKVSGGFANLKINSKIGVLVFALTVAALVVGLVGIARMSALNDELATMKTKHVESMAYLSEARGNLALMWRSMFIVQVSTSTAKTDAVADTKTADGDVDAALASYAKAATGSSVRLAAIASAQEALATFRTLRNVIVFREAPPSGFTMPTDVAGAFGAAETALSDATAKLQELERSEAQAMADEATATYSSSRNIMIITLVCGLAVGLGLWYLVTTSIKRQVVTVGTALHALARNDLAQSAVVYGGDEIGAMAVAVNEARDGLRDTVDQINGTARTLAGTGVDLAALTREISESAQKAASQASIVADAAETVSSNVSTVAAGSEQMGASIREISQNANDAASVASEAVGVAEKTNQIVSQLGESSAEIGNVVKTITSIAEQTNLLALNATIEAARAGELGKGFAVVAGEVKDLAQETAKATDDISRRVEAIQSDAVNAVGAIAEISRIIARINDYQLTIASAVEEQTATTSEMSRSVSDASSSTSDIAANITGVADAAQATTSALSKATTTVERLGQASADLQTVVGRFRL
ncbi:methyl-accepting chemotaxis protein [Actinoplanes tereljensis]|uniref:Methyl-accepting chemotaxis protein n=1 Tax=Paractinoplanes tereljensis TaxID=571912 RepID=A0A919NN29_9ACTN|nr:methyl-accepting chemotaxis protein [Actinoplanes tereljensis]GIF21879.1 hypothetical protein Ate02nite_46090 [Actinoplanes tereljensis]